MDENRGRALELYAELKCVYIGQQDNRDYATLIQVWRQCDYVFEFTV